MELFLFLLEKEKVVTRSQFRRLLIMERILVNGKIITFEEQNYKLKEKDVVTLIKVTIPNQTFIFEGETK